MNIYRVGQPRSSFARVRNAEQIDVLTLAAHVSSWQGIERFNRLLLLSVEPGCLPDDDATPIGSLVSLSSLELTFTTLPAGLPAVGALAALKHLTLWDDGAVSTLPADPAWLEGLVGLETLTIVNAGGGPLVTASLGVVRSLPKLQTLVLTRVIPHEGPALFAGGFPALRELACTTTDDFAVESIHALRPDVVIDYREEFEGPIGPTILDHGDDGFSVYLDLVPEVDGAENNYEALEVVRERLARADPELAARLGWDPEADGTAVLARSREALERFLEILPATRPR
jgi:hypothetical protein